MKVKIKQMCFEELKVVTDIPSRHTQYQLLSLRKQKHWLPKRGYLSLASTSITSSNSSLIVQNHNGFHWRNKSDVTSCWLQIQYYCGIHKTHTSWIVPYVYTNALAITRLWSTPLNLKWRRTCWTRRGPPSMRMNCHLESSAQPAKIISFLSFPTHLQEWILFQCHDGSLDSDLFVVFTHLLSFWSCSRVSKWSYLGYVWYLMFNLVFHRTHASLVERCQLTKAVLDTPFVKRCPTCSCQVKAPTPTAGIFNNVLVACTNCIYCGSSI